MQAHHTLVTGSSGGGKTTLLRQYHAEFRGRSVFLTTKRNERKAEKNPPDRLRQSSCTYPDDIQTAREWAHRQSGPVQIIVDECQNAPSLTEDTQGPLRSGLHEDRDQAIKWVPSTQDPQDLEYPPLKQCRYIVWCGRVQTFHKGFIQYYNLHEVEGGELPSEPYRYVTIDPSLPPRIVHEGMTDPKYA